ncbi:SDR family oxidoreductase [Roseobacter sp. HKCCA0434]|uniref:SDR family NAD(P)-dependent oxidoreductase n=1 Tax=Roseobacter sp. HKCCA0434 TaxID=3079297 RepID=UPI002905B36A|nr:SDR family oxidoreductase [Roseobacter sp. HKCCA0434]
MDETKPLRWTLITGASEGIGLELARIAASHGRNVLLAARSRNKLEVLATELSALGVEAVAIRADLSTPDGAKQLWEEASAGRSIDFLINNAGLGHNGRFHHAEGWEAEKRILDVNVSALTELTKLALPGMVERGAGRVLNVASIAGFIPGPGMAVYNASKAFVLSFSQAVNAELEGKGVTVTALCPGATQTGFFDTAGMTGTRITQQKLPSAASVAKVGYEAAVEGRPVAIPGADNKAIAFATRLLPRSVFIGATKRLFSRSR